MDGWKKFRSKYTNFPTSFVGWCSSRQQKIPPQELRLSSIKRYSRIVWCTRTMARMSDYWTNSGSVKLWLMLGKRSDFLLKPSWFFYWILGFWRRWSNERPYLYSFERRQTNIRFNWRFAHLLRCLWGWLQWGWLTPSWEYWQYNGIVSGGLYNETDAVSLVKMQ